LAAGPAAAQERLSGPEIRRLVSGRSASWTTPDGYKGSITYNPNGTLSASTRILGTDQRLSGTWEIRGDRFCRSIALDLVRTRCQTVQRVSAGTFRFYNEDGRLATVTTFR